MTSLNGTFGRFTLGPRLRVELDAVARGCENWQTLAAPLDLKLVSARAFGH